MKNVKSELLRFIDFHARSSSSNVNSVNGIVSSRDILSEIINTLTLLQQDYSALFYTKSTDVNRFLRKLADDLKHEKKVLIVADTLDFDPIVYDQLIQFRDNNEFTINLDNGEKSGKFPSSSKIFLFSNNQKNQDIHELANHVLDLEEQIYG